MMRSGYSKDEFLLAAALKKPRLQALIDRVSEMSIADIDSLSEALWIKEALKILKQSGGVGQKERVSNIVNRAIAAEEAAKKLPKETYEIRLWDGPSCFVGQNRQADYHEWKIEVQPGDSVMIVDDDHVRFGDSMIKVDDPNKTILLQQTKFVGYMTLDTYRGFHRALLNKRHRT